MIGPLAVLCDIKNVHEGKKYSILYHNSGSEVHGGIKHTKIVHGGKISEKFNLKKHIGKVHDKVKHVCKICDKGFQFRFGLKKHMEYKHKK